ncbi:MAG: hypothetical protein ACOCWH_01440, partial [Spirochaetota bacterium]
DFKTGKFSDDYAEPMDFTGVIAGIYCQDPNGSGIHADFRSIEKQSA